jgi:hypothetical protein
VISDGMAEVLRSLRLDEDGDARAAACTRALGAAGVAVSLLAGDSPNAELLWCFPELSGRFEDLQFTLGEGPGPDAVRTGVPVVEPDLERVRPDRWPALLPAAQELGVQGVCCYPLGVGAIRLGVLTVLCDGERRLSDQGYADAGALTAALTGAVLNGEYRSDPDQVFDRKSGAPAVDGSPTTRESGGLHRAAVHQATGMISVQLAVPMAEALLRLRAHSYGSGRGIGDVAADVVARRLRFDDYGSGPYSPDGGKG